MEQGALLSAASGGAKADIKPQTFLVGILLLISCLYWLLARDSYMGDFRAFYVAAVSTQAHLDPYRNNVDIDERYADADSDRVESRFIYPPSALLYFLPFEMFRYNIAKLAFAGLVILPMAGILLFFNQRFEGITLVLIGLFVSLPMVANVDNGQIDVLILALLLMSFYLGNGWKAGLCLGVAISIKVVPIFAVLWFLGQRRWRTAVWSVVLSGGLTLLAVARWGTGRYWEFVQHLANHVNRHGAVLHHHFQTIQVTDSRFIVVGTMSYALGHHVYGYIQNPLLQLGRFGSVAGLLIVLSYLGWAFFSAKGRSLSPEAGFFGLLVVSLFANTLLWTMGLVACFPLLLLLVDKSRTPAKTALLLMAPLFLPFSLVADRRFAVWLAAAAFCVWHNARDSQDRAGSDHVLGKQRLTGAA
jgi:hypothetical protein